jgi:predicted amidohydrolase YtcJ
MVARAKTTIGFVGVLAFMALAAGQTPAPAELILVNGHVITVDRNFSIAQAVAIADGRFTAVGTNDAIRKLAGPSTKIVDLAGQTAIPGLADDHLHDAGGGPGVDLSQARSIADVLNAVAARVNVSRPGDIIVTNSDWHEAQLTEHRLPYRKDLDTVSPANPVVAVRGGHEYILNSAALKKWNITKETPQRPGGRITRDSDGELNGELVDRAKSLVQLPPPPKLTIEALIGQHKKLNAAGLTSIRYPGASIDQYRLLQEMRRRGLLTIRVTQLMRTAADATSGVGRRGPASEEPGGVQGSPPFNDEQKLRAAIQSWNVKPDEGDEWLRIGGMKLGVDGGFEGGWMREPYAELWGERGTFRGVNTMPQAPFTAAVKALNRLGWRVATHAVGDAAIDEVLAAYEAANAEQSIVGKRWTIEHGFIPQPDQFPRMKQLGLVISAQDHLYLAGPSLVKYWGPKRAAWTTPMRTYLDQGFVVAGGTDSAVVPYSPLRAIYHLVTRDTISGGTLGTDQKISRREALQVETINNAYLTFEERIKGSIEPGKLADLVVLPEDILTCPAKHIEQMRVVMTMVGGKIVYRRSD